MSLPSARGAAEPSSAPRPRLVVSRCLELDACRYNGQTIRSWVVRALAAEVELVPVCPEVEIGLGVPRDPIRLVRVEGVRRLVQPSTDRDLTGAMEGFSARFLDGVGEVDGFLLKSRSPSCGPGDAKLHAAADGPPLERTSGLFAEAVEARFPDHAVEHEGRLTNLAIRDHFLTRLFAHAALRRALEGGRVADLVDFQARFKLVLMAHAPEAQRRLGRLVAEADGMPFEEVARRYADGFRRALGRRPGPGAHQNVIQHAMGYFKEGLGAAEKRHFLELVERYRDGRVGRGALLALLNSWIVRFDQPYLARQAYFSPYPATLSELADSGGSGRL